MVRVNEHNTGTPIFVVLRCPKPSLAIIFETAAEPVQAAAKEIAAAVEKGKLTEIEINVARELYRKQATEGAMLYFLLTKL